MRSCLTSLDKFRIALWRFDHTGEAGWVLQTIGDIAAFTGAVLAVVFLCRSVLEHDEPGSAKRQVDQKLGLLVFGVLCAGITIASVSVDTLRGQVRGNGSVAYVTNYGNAFADASWPVIGTVMLLLATASVLFAAPFITNRAVAFGLILGIAGYWLASVSADLADLAWFSERLPARAYGFPSGTDLRYDIGASGGFSLRVIGVVLLTTLAVVYWRQSDPGDTTLAADSLT
jgi:xanthine/uracil permease